MRFGTRAIHAGQEPDPRTGAITAPIYQTSTYALEDPSAPLGYEYSRHDNPNYTFLEDVLASLEGGEFATVFSSGIAAATAIGATLSVGDRVVGLTEVYGGTYRLFTDTFQRLGIDFVIVAAEGDVEKALEPPTKVLLFETPTNPLMEVIDIERVAALAKERGVLTVVDNTFASPFFQNPLKWGADVVWHSTTKYIGGHSDLIGGALITDRKELKEAFDLQRMTLGLNPGPFDTWLALRGVKTLSVRMPEHEKNGLALASWLEGQSCVKRVLHPGLESHRQHALAKRQMSGFSGMFSVEFDLSYEQTLKLIKKLKLFSLAISLGGVESLVNHSASMSHAALPKEVRQQQGISDSLVRFSVGIEDQQDLLDDLRQALPVM